MSTEVNVGDVMYVNSYRMYRPYTRVTITKLTPTQIVTISDYGCEYRFKKENMRGIGSVNGSSLIKGNQKVVDSFNRQSISEKLRIISATNNYDLSSETLAELLILLDKILDKIKGVESNERKPLDETESRVKMDP